METLIINKVLHRLPQNRWKDFMRVCNTYGMDKSEKRLAHFLSQIEHETNTFKFFEENLSYSAKRLREVFPRYFKTDEIAKKYERKKEAIGNRVYANRMGNGSESSGDGFRFRGRGAIQLTGKNNYTAFFKSISQSLNPDLVSDTYAFDAAAWFWNVNKINEKIDNGADVNAVTRIVNGGLNGIADRQKKYNDIMNLLK